MALEPRVDDKSGTLEGGATRYQSVVTRLRLDIINGIWRSDARLKVRDLAAHYGVGSPAPIREALQQLQGEGLVVMEPNRGARVRRMDEDLIMNIFEVREALEAALTAKFAASASPHQIAMLEELQVAHDAAVAASDDVAMFHLNYDFHRLILNAARNPEAMDVIRRHQGLIRALRLECKLSKRRMLAAREEHHQLLDALRRGDAPAAGRISALHVRSSRDDLLERMEDRLAR